MFRHHRRFPGLVLCLGLGLGLGAPAGAVTIFESATLGATGQSGGTSVNGSQFVGVRFQVTQPVNTGSIGAHLAGAFDGAEIFGAIILLSGPSDVPDSADLSTPDVLGAAILSLPALSDEVTATLELSLAPGWYALVLGSGLFGAGDSGSLPGGDSDIGSPPYFFKNGFDIWQEGGFSSRRLFVVSMPEPSTAALLAGGLALLGARRRLRY